MGSTTEAYSMLHRLTRLAEVYNIAFVLTNQVQSNPDTTFASDPTKEVVGIFWHMLLHTGFSSEKQDVTGLQ